MASDVNEPQEGAEPDSAAPKKRRILIGSQKEPEAYRPKRHDWTPVEEAVPGESGPAAPVSDAAAQPATPAREVLPADYPATVSPAQSAPVEASAQPVAPPPDELLADDESEKVPSIPQGLADQLAAAQAAPTAFPPPRSRDRVPLDSEEDWEASLADVSLDDLLADSDRVSKQTTLEIDSRQKGRVIAVRRDDVFIELSGREQGVVSVRQFAQPPSPGATVEVVIKRFDPDEGLYELHVPGVAASVADWGDIREGAVVEAKVTGQNTGGLECEVNKLRGFIPFSQVALYRVENLDEFIDQKLLCVVAEADPERRKLVLSRRAVLERQREEAKQTFFASLEIGQVRDGVVRKLMDFGAFVDLGGVDGLLHVSQLSWSRVKHPSEVLQEGQPVRVRIEKIDPATHKISLGYRDMLENPWNTAARKYPPNTVASGVVSKIMEFGAFVQLEPGVEGLVHISELSTKRVRRATEVVQEGQPVEVLVLSVDPSAQRMSLSMKVLAAKSEAEEAQHVAESTPAAPPPAPARSKPSAPLKGGLGRGSGGEQFGLKW